MDAFELSPFQKEAIDAILAGDHVLVCAPTGSGKTLPAEFAIRHFTQMKKKVIYTSPIKALSNQKYHDFVKKFPEISVGLCTGDIKTNPTADLIIMTAEILNNRLFHITSESSSLDFQMNLETELGVVIMDEVHYINDAARGHVWEQTILTLPPQVQMVMLSATLDEPEKFAGWIESTRLEETRSDITAKKRVRLAITHKRVVPLTHYAYVPSTESFLKSVKDKAIQQTIRHSTNKLIQIQTPTNKFLETGYAELKYVLDTYDQKDVRLARKYTLNNLASFLKGSDDMDTDDTMLPAIVFVFSRKQVERCAEEITASILPFDSKIPYTIARECEQLVRRLPNYKEYLELPEYVSLVKLLEKGVAIHHSGMIPILREIVELMISKKYVYLLFATESFAIGLDCPIKTAVFTDIEKYDGKGKRALLAHEYTQMAGRAGRRGIDTVGNVVLLPTLFHGIPSKDTLKRVLSNIPQTLVSKFQIDYSMILRLLKKGVSHDFHQFAEKSMMNEETRKRAQAQHSEVKKLEQGAAGPLTLRTPLDACQECLRLEMEIKTSVNKKRKLAEQAMRALLNDHRFLQEDAKTVQNYNARQLELEQAREYAKGFDLYLETQTKIVCRLLETHGAIVSSDTPDAFSLTEYGNLAAQIAETHPLLLAKCVPFLSALSVDQLIGFLSSFVDIKIPEPAEYPRTKDPVLKTRLEQVVEWKNAFYQDEVDLRADTGIQYDRILQFDLTDEFMEWSRFETEEECKALLQQVHEKGVSTGDFAKVGMKICAIAKELEKATESIELRHKLSQVDGKVLKYITTTQSLYL